MSHQGLTSKKKLLQSFFESVEVHDYLKCCMRIIQIVNVYVFAVYFPGGLILEVLELLAKFGKFNPQGKK